MECVRVEGDTETNDTETTKGKIKDKNESCLTDVLDINTRLSLETTEISEEPHTNGISQENGLCESFSRTTDSSNHPPQSQTMETSHLNQHGTF